MVNKTQIAKKETKDILGIMAVKYNLQPSMFLNTIKATVMKPGKDGRIPSNEEIAAFLVVANKYNLDPFTNEIYAFPSKKGGIIPIVGIDGFVAQMNRNPEFNGMDLEFAEDCKTMDGAKSCPEWCEVKIYKKGIDKPIVVREYLDEVYCPPKGGYPGPWQSHTKRMLRHKTIIQGARVAFGITGIYDQDEAERIIEAQASAPEVSMKPEVDMPKAVGEVSSAGLPADDLPKGDTGSQVSLISQAQASRLMAIAKSKGYSENDVVGHLVEFYGIDSTAKISREYYEEIVTVFQTPKAKDE